jgi:conjugal transfer pilus assembly protein TraW
MNLFLRPVLFAGLVALAACNVHATDLGVIGPTYAITEPHLLKMIEQRLREKERSGELQRLETETRERGIAAVKSPPAVAGLRATQTARTFYVDPSFTLDRNVLDAQGRLMFPAGTRKNPLEVVSLSKHLLFFDARDRRQVTRARELLATYQGLVKPILTGGSYLDLMKSWRIPVYYDQQGLLTRRFGIRQVPALVSQDGQQLRVDELEIAK